MGLTFLPPLPPSLMCKERAYRIRVARTLCASHEGEGRGNKRRSHEGRRGRATEGVKVTGFLLCRLLPPLLLFCRMKEKKNKVPTITTEKKTRQFRLERKKTQEGCSLLQKE